MIKYKEEDPRTVPGLLMELFIAHGKEAVGPGFNLYLVMFANAINAGTLRFYTAYNEDKIVGYCVYMIGFDLMRAHVKTADCSAIYVLPEYRGKVSVRLIRFSEQCLIAEGCKSILAHSRKSAPNITKLYQHMGYDPYDIVLEKRIA